LYKKIKEIIKNSIKSNKQYTLSLEKKIKFTSHIQGKHPRYYVYKILSITNNIITNSIEAIENTGEIIIYVRKHNDKIEFQLEDNGPGIGQSNIDLIFETGFTDKYDSKGNPFTGIGMTYVKKVIENLDVEIFIKNKKNEIQLEDNGIGIRQSNIYLIYEPGLNDKYDSKGNPFTGIGMPYVKKVIESLDGEIFLKNKKNGLHFTIQLPIKKITLKG